MKHTLHLECCSISLLRGCVGAVDTEWYEIVNEDDFRSFFFLYIGAIKKLFCCEGEHSLVGMSYFFVIRDERTFKMFNVQIFLKKVGSNQISSNRTRFLLGFFFGCLTT